MATVNPQVTDAVESSNAHLQNLTSAVAGIGLTKESIPTTINSSATSSSSPTSITHVDEPRLGPDPRTVFLPLRLHSIQTSYIAKSNHFLQCDPLVVVAIDNRPQFKTSIKKDSTNCHWNLSDKSELQPVPSGLNLQSKTSFSGSYPTLQIPVSDLSTSKLQVCQEDFSKLKGGDDMGGFSIPIEEIVTRSWKVEKKVTSATVSPTSPVADGSTSSPPAPVTPVASAIVDGWYPVSITDASLMDHVSGRALGSISLQLSLQLEQYLQYLVASQTGLHVLYELTQQFLNAPSTESPLRHILLHPPSLKAFIAYIVKAGADRGSMDGERMRERVFTLLGKALDTFKPESQILDTFFANNSELWSTLFQIRRCIPASTLSSASAFHTYETLIENYCALIHRVGLLLEPLPPPPVKTEEELAAEAAAEALAQKKAALKEKKRRKAAIEEGLDPDDPANGLPAEPPASASKKKKKSGANVLPEPPAHLPSKLSFGLNTLDILHELFEVFHIRLTGFKKSADFDWNSESKVADLIKCCEFLYTMQAFLFQYGSWSNLVPGADATPEALAEYQQQKPRLGVDEIRPFFLKETGDAHAIWWQKLLAVATKKTKELLEENRELASKVQQHAEYWIRLYPVEKSSKPERKSTSGKKKSSS